MHSALPPVTSRITLNYDAEAPHHVPLNHNAGNSTLESLGNKVVACKNLVAGQDATRSYTNRSHEFFHTFAKYTISAGEQSLIPFPGARPFEAVRQTRC